MKLRTQSLNNAYRQKMLEALYTTLQNTVHSRKSDVLLVEIGIANKPATIRVKSEYTKMTSPRHDFRSLSAGESEAVLAGIRSGEPYNALCFQILEETMKKAGLSSTSYNAAPGKYWSCTNHEEKSVCYHPEDHEKIIHALDELRKENYSHMQEEKTYWEDMIGLKHGSPSQGKGH